MTEEGIDARSRVLLDSLLRAVGPSSYERPAELQLEQHVVWAGAPGVAAVDGVVAIAPLKLKSNQAIYQQLFLHLRHLLQLALHNPAVQSSGAIANYPSIHWRKE